MKICLNKNVINAIDVSYGKRYSIEDEFYLIDAGVYHYGLLSFLATEYFNDALFFDVGTCTGNSAIALSANRSNRVISYDVVPFRKIKNEDELTNVEFKIGKAIIDDELKNADLCFLDTYHKGGFEKLFIGTLRLIGFKGIVLCDDIYLNQAMINFWQGVKQPKWDISKYGHDSGTGLIDFSGELKVEMQ